MRTQADDLTRSRATNNTWSFAFGLPGIGLSIASAFFSDSVVSWSMLIVGYLLIWVGIFFAVQFKRDNPEWSLLGLLAIVGLIVLACISDEKGIRLRRMRDWLGETKPQPPPKKRLSRRAVAIIAGAACLLLLVSGVAGYFIFAPKPKDPPPFATFLKKTPPASGTVRVWCSGGMGDARWGSDPNKIYITLSEGDTSRGFTFHRGDDLGERLAELLKSGPRKMNVKLALSPGDAPDSPVLTILGVDEDQ